MSFEKIRRIRVRFDGLKDFLNNKNDTSWNLPKNDTFISDYAKIDVDIPAVRDRDFWDNLCKMEHKIISYFSDFQNNNYYRDFAIRLEKKCKIFGVKYEITELTSRGSYGANCLMKPLFISESLKENKKPLIWMDCDTDFREPFPDFNDCEDDIGMTTHSGEMDGIKASPVFFNYTPGAFLILKEWVLHTGTCYHNSITELDHDSLKHYVLRVLEDKYSIRLLKNNWVDFVNGRYIVNGNSKVEGKSEIHRMVAVSDEVREEYIKNVKNIHILFSEKNPNDFNTALKYLDSFSNLSRLFFHFSDELKSKLMDNSFKRLYIESGGRVEFNTKNDFEEVIPADNEVFINANKLFDLCNGWDNIISEKIAERQDPIELFRNSISKIKTSHKTWI